MKETMKICPGLYQVGGGSLSHPDDCCVYLVESDGEGALIDTGIGLGSDIILANIISAGLKLEDIRYIILTHGHIDHIGGLRAFAGLEAKIIAHRKDLPAIEEGLESLTAANYYGIRYQGYKVDIILDDPETFALGKLEICCIPTPGHTPGSISVYFDSQGTRVLFGQDIHGPFNPNWGSDIKQWRTSMEKLLRLNADILCEGHFGIYSPAEKVRKYIEGYINQYS